MRLEISALSKPGGREPNEDAFGCWSSETASFCLVCDGAGGHGGGEIASRLAVRVVLAQFQANAQCDARAIAAAITAAQQAMLAAQREGSGAAHMRATTVVLAIDTVRAIASWGHLGDTRLYCFRDHRIIARTKDHSVVQRMVDAGYLRDGDLREAVERNRLFAALGQTENFAPTVITEPLRLQNGDAFLLCTDGFWDNVADEQMIAALAQSPSTQEWLAHMERDVIARGGPDQDNYSALAVWCGEWAPPNGAAAF